MNKVKLPTISRRSFLKRTALATGAVLGFPHIVPSTVFGQNAPSNRIVMAGVGMGGMGTNNLNSFLGKREVQFIAVCDVDAGHLERAKNRINSHYKNQNCKTYRDFRELIARGDIDALSMATPDHWHAIIAIAALRAGIDMYGEKPLTHDLREGRALCDTASRYGRVWQTGSWQRSQGHFHFACELVRNGRIGKIHTVEVGLPNGKTGGGLAVQPVPANLDWNFWLGPVPARPYQGTCHNEWRWVLDWGGGQMMDWIGHHADIAQWGLGTETTGPIEIEGAGDFPKDGLYDAPTSYKFTGTYATGTRIIVANQSQQPRGMGTRWIGDKGWVYVDRGGKLDAEPKSLLREKISDSEIRLYRSRDHHQNFIDCIRSRQPTIAPAEVAHRSASIGHLGQIAMLTGRKIRWNPETESIINDASASALLGRTCREPWTIA